MEAKGNKTRSLADLSVVSLLESATVSSWASPLQRNANGRNLSGGRRSLTAATPLRRTISVKKTAALPRRYAERLKRFVTAIKGSAENGRSNQRLRQFQQLRQLCSEATRLERRPGTTGPAVPSLGDRYTLTQLHLPANFSIFPEVSDATKSTCWEFPSRFLLMPAYVSPM